MVDYKSDIKEPYRKLFKGAYEKANIWPYENAEAGKDILLEEICEAAEGIVGINDWVTRQDEVEKGLGYTHHEILKLKAITVSTIMELMQVLSVCNKYDAIFDSYARRERASDEK